MDNIYEKCISADFYKRNSRIFMGSQSGIKEIRSMVMGDEDHKKLDPLVSGVDFKPDISKGLYIGASLNLASLDDEERYVPRPRYIPWSDLSGHMAVYGTTRVGKTRLMMSFCDQIIARQANLLAFEPKGSVGSRDIHGNMSEAGQESIGWILEFAEKHGRLRDIRYISPAFHEYSWRINPIFGMKDEEIASLIASITPADDEFFKKIGYQTSYAILIGLRFLEMAEGFETVNEALKIEYEKAYFGTLLEERNPMYKIFNPDLAERIYRPIVSKLGTDHIPPFRTLLTLEDLERYMSYQGIKQMYDMVSAVTPDQYNARDDHEAYRIDKVRKQALMILKRMTEKDATYYGKVSTSFETLFSQMSKGDIGEIFCSVKINPLIDALLDPDQGLIAIVQPYPLTYGDAANIFVRTFFAMMQSFYGNIGASGRATPRETFMAVDEGGAVLFPGVQELFNKGGGLGLRLMIFTQSFSDYKAGLGEEIAEIVNDNTNIKIFMRMNDLQSRKLVAEAFGKLKVREASYMGSKLDMRINTREDEKDILLPSHIGDMQKQEFLLQYGEGRYYCIGPDMPDPKYFVKMPKTYMEKIYVEQGRKFINEITNRTFVNQGDRL